MAVLPVIRESPVQEVVQIRNKGSYTIPEEARKAHRLLVDIRILSVTRNQYSNLMYNLPQGEYGNCTYWSGAAINDTRKIKYPNERLIDWVNVEASAAFNAGLAAEVPNRSVGALGLAMGFPVVKGDRRPPIVWGFLTSHLKFVLYPDTQLELICQWYPWPDIDEFEEPDPDLDDPASGEDEYPSPKRNPRDEPWEGNPPSSGIDGSRDPRDFDDANVPPPPGSPGPDCTKTYRIVASGETTDANGVTYPWATEGQYLGEIVSVGPYFNPAFNSWAYRITQKTCDGQINYLNMFGTTGVVSLTGSHTVTEV